MNKQLVDNATHEFAWSDLQIPNFPDKGILRVKLQVIDREEYSTRVSMEGTVAKNTDDPGEPFMGEFVIREGRDALETTPADQNTQAVATAILILLDEFAFNVSPNLLMQEMDRILG